MQALDGYATKIVAMQLQTDYQSILAVKHSGKRQDNPHYHIVVKTNVKPQAFRVRMKNTFNEGKGNEHMSIRAWDGDTKALSYLFHEDNDVDPITRHGISDKFLSELRTQNAQISERVATLKGKSSHTLFDDAVIHFGKIAPDVASVNRLSFIDMASFMILHALRAGKYSPSPWLLKQMVLKVRYALLRGDVHAEESFAIQLATEIYRNN
ncbi:MAG: hypothetical protein H7836_17285 [Magnetococcus sp. YQC-3]